MRPSTRTMRSAKRLGHFRHRTNKPPSAKQPPRRVSGHTSSNDAMAGARDGPYVVVCPSPRVLVCDIHENKNRTRLVIPTSASLDVFWLTYDHTKIDSDHLSFRQTFRISNSNYQAVAFFFFALLAVLLPPVRLLARGAAVRHQLALTAPFKLRGTFLHLHTGRIGTAQRQSATAPRPRACDAFGPAGRSCPPAALREAATATRPQDPTSFA